MAMRDGDDEVVMGSNESKEWDEVMKWQVYNDSLSNKEENRAEV